MPQEFHALRCVECRTFQVHIVKKIAKWTCKICQKKQSVLQEFAQGNGKECRLVVQRLNELRLQQDSLPVAIESNSYHEPRVQYETTDSKWSKYLSEEEESAEEEQEPDVSIDDAGLAREQKCMQRVVASFKKTTWDRTEPCGAVQEEGNRPKQHKEVDQTGEKRRSQQVRGLNLASKWAKYVDPVDEGDSSTGGTFEANCRLGDFEDQEEDLDELLKF